MILECGHPPTSQTEGSITTGYGSDGNGFRRCFACCAEVDRAYMIEHGRITLYLSQPTSERPRGSLSHAGFKLTNWPGSLAFPLLSLCRSKGRGFGGEYPRESFRFNGPDGFVWYGIRQGHHTQIAHCRRTQAKVQ